MEITKRLMNASLQMLEKSLTVLSPLPKEEVMFAGELVPTNTEQTLNLLHPTSQKPSLTGLVYKSLHEGEKASSFKNMLIRGRN